MRLNVQFERIEYNKFGDIKLKSKDELNKIYKEIGLTPTGGLAANSKSTSSIKSAIKAVLMEVGGLALLPR